MLFDISTPDHFWVEVVSTACHILKRCLIRTILNKTPYELWRGKKQNSSYFHPFRCKCFIYNNVKNSLGKFDTRSDEGIFLGYALVSRGFHVSNKRIISVYESLHVFFDDTNTRVHDIEAGDDEITSPKTNKIITVIILKMMLKSQLLQRWSRILVYIRQI